MAAEYYPTDALISERDVLESMTADGIVDLILEHGERVSEIERVMNLAADVLEGAYGTTVEAELDKRERERERKNGQT